METIAQKLPTIWSEREKLRDKGQFWTPSWVAQAMVAYTAQESDLIFDPATGNGAFFDALLKLQDTEIKFYGTDIDAKVLGGEIYQNSQCQIEQRDFIKNPPNRKFKAIVGNPPYIRHHRLNEETKIFLKRLCKQITGFTIDGRAGYHIYFLLQALSLLESGGRLAFIMPADVCEGVSAKKLWSWIVENFRLEAVLTFAESAAPFPNVDTNALVFFIKNEQPKTTFSWAKVSERKERDLSDFVLSNFKQYNFHSIEVIYRQISEAIETGLSRPPQKTVGESFYLSDFADVMRGIATGANEFFFLTKQQVENIGIPEDFLKRAIGRTKDVAEDVLTEVDLENLDNKNRPTYLLSINGHCDFPKTIADYLEIGENLGLPGRALIKQRKPWYKMEKRTVPPLLFAYLGRRNTRFIKNEAGVLPLTSFLCVYPFSNNKKHLERLWQALNHKDTLENLKLVSKSYGSGAIKVEPSNLRKLRIPTHIIRSFGLETVQQDFQAKLFDS
jgi:methylase of polypeptide subunit release factors